MEMMKKKLEEQEAADREKAAKLEHYEKLEQQRREQYAKDNEAKLKEYLETTKEQYGSDLPPEFAESMTTVFKTPEMAANTNVIMASALKYKQEKAEREKLQGTIDELLSKVKKLEDQQPLTNALVQANQRRLGLVTETNESVGEKEPVKELSVGASAGNGKVQMSDLFQPSQEERALYKMTTGKDVELNVNASNSPAASIPQAPVHNHVKAFPHSMRNLKSGSKLFDFLCSREFSSIPNMIIADKTTIVDEEKLKK